MLTRDEEQVLYDHTLHKLIWHWPREYRRTAAEPCFNPTDVMPPIWPGRKGMLLSKPLPPNTSITSLLKRQQLGRLPSRNNASARKAVPSASCPKTPNSTAKTSSATNCLQWAGKWSCTDPIAQTLHSWVSSFPVPEQRPAIQAFLQRRWTESVPGGFLCVQDQIP